MISLKDWNTLYRFNTSWVLEKLRFPNKDEKDWIEALKVFHDIEEELFNNFDVRYKSGSKFKRGCLKGIEINAEQLFEFFHNHMKKYDNFVIRSYIFHWWNDLRGYVQYAEPPLDQAYLFFKDATEEEVKQAEKDFSIVHEENEYEHKHTFNRARVLEYRGNRFIVDDEWDCAWTKNKEDKPVYFQLDWDWWYPIDSYLDLYCN